MKRRALVCAQWVPEFDRNRGAQRVDAMIRFLVDDGWSVQFLSERHEGDDWHVQRLRQLGVATFVGFEHAESVVSSGNFDLAVLAFWQPAERLLPIIRSLSPETKVLIDSIDLHFLREARRAFGMEGRLDDRYGATVVRELNTYQQADALLTTSAKEEEWLNDIVGPHRARWLAMEEPVTGSPPPLEGRRGILFVGYFRHLPNGEAVEYLCRDILPLIDPDLLAQHPLTVIGSGLDEKVRAHAKNLQHVEMIGWVPSVFPYFRRARVCAFPLLHGAGVKGKVLQAFMMGTPVVTTHIGIEGLGVSDGEQVMVAETPGDTAAAITRLLTDHEAWSRKSEAGRKYVLALHDEDAVRRDFLAIVEEVVSRRVIDHSGGDGFRHGQRRHRAYQRTIAAVRETVRTRTEPGEVVLVISKGDDQLLDLDGRVARHFPQALDGEWAGFHPADSDHAIRLLEEQRRLGARYLLLPDSSYWWLHHYREFALHLEAHCEKVHSDETVIVYDMQEVGPESEWATDVSRSSSVLVLGTYGKDLSGPPPENVEALDATAGYMVTQRWGTVDDMSVGDPDDPVDADWVVFADASAVMRPGFLDDFLALADRLGADRAQPAHSAGPSVLPVGAQLGGCVARLLPKPVPIPVLAVRSHASAVGPVMVLDTVPIGLRKTPQAGVLPGAAVTDVITHGPSGFERAVHRHTATEEPVISVLIATFQRPSLLASCLEGFRSQTLDDSSFEVVVVDDGSSGDETTVVLEEYAKYLPLSWVRIDHAGRSAAKNLCILLARGDLVLFFDDDDRPAADLLEQHVLAHRQYPEEGTAVLGHTDWAPELELTPLMHYLTDVDRLLFSYGSLKAEVANDWRCFWEGRISCKRALLLRNGLHDQRINYSIDVELSWRLKDHGLTVRYWPGARSYMARPMDLDDFSARMEGKGRAQARLASLHPSDEMRQYTKLSGAHDRWQAARESLGAVVERARRLQEELCGSWNPSDHRLADLHNCYRAIFDAYYAKGMSEAVDSEVSAQGISPEVDNGTGPAGQLESVSPALSVVIPVWSRTPELADMAVRTIERVWAVSQVPTEVIVIDNGSPHQRPLRAIVHRFEENRGVSIAWNVGGRLARAPVLAFLNSDCLVESGWDVALMEAATTDRRIGFPYTDHGDGQGYRQPDQGGTAGWCFAITARMFEEIGPFDERFSPAFGEDTDYWHRAWELGVELSPVPAARVAHVRRATTSLDPHVDWLLQGHRYKYGWKHGVDPLRAPPYYNRSIVEYHYSGQPELSRG
jgi:glycosyltransferase involved in cell wall biosynthesis